ncbi:MAG: hypothetical protein AAF085_11805 [Planctomycetota bacterium]
MNNHLIHLFTASLLAIAILALPTHADQAEIPEELKERVETEGWSQQWHDELYSHEDPAVGATLRKMLRAKRDAAALQSDLVVHEWGAMQHHVGTATSEFDLIGEDQSDLPAFVEVWAKQRPAQGPQIMLKPIIYFYTQTQQTVDVSVRYPEGVLTQWYPQVSFFTPQRNNRVRPGNVPDDLPRDGSLSWSKLKLDPQTKPTAFANVAPDHPWWHTARETDATPVTVTKPLRSAARGQSSTERFLFYRGAGAYKPMVMPKREKPGVDLSVTVPFSQIDLRGVFLVRVNDSGAIITHAPLLRAQGTLELAGAEQIMPTVQAAKSAKAMFIESLEAAGLFPKEAAGLVKIWGDEMFTTPGERLIYLMPNNEVERVMPLTIRPEPTHTVRTLIGWVELATPEGEKRVEDLIDKLGSENPSERSDADQQLRRLDRFAEAILRRTLETTEDTARRNQIEQILADLAQQRRQGSPPRNRP